MATETTPVHSPAMESRFFAKAFIDKDFSALPLVFEMRVLEKYVQAGNVVYRTNSAGRVDAKVWRVDFGIVDVAGVIHAQAGDVFKLPQAEREHWAAHIAAPPLNARFLKMRLGLGACIDEGDIELWDGTPR